MLAIDTNVVVRLLIDDNPEQTARARALLGRPLMISSTVLLESAWVLGSAYKLSERDVLEGLRAILGLPGVVADRPDIVAQALAWADAGTEIADALHLAASAECEAMVTFDKRLVRSAGRLGAADVREP